jgi:PAS domain S-box-containing protein
MPKRKMTKKNHSSSAKSKLIGPVNEPFLGSLIEHLPNMVFIKDALELGFVHFNKTGEELLGMTRDQLIGKNDYVFFPEDQAKFFVEKDRQVFEQGDVLLIPEEKI